ncbi:MAG TPA: phage holin family protein [Tepidisphaeraceae bacterium]|nr:phage holin family protein [Tepidisphaeraceae bacterium]
MDESDVQAGGSGARTYEMPSGNGKEHHRSPREAAAQVGKLINEYREYLSYFLSAKIDGVRFSVRQSLVYAALGVVGLIAGAATIVMGVVLLLLGAARGLGSAFGTRLQWLGDLIIGLVVLSGIALAIYIGVRRMTASSRKKTMEKYEQRQNWERQQFGRSASEQAALSQAQRV